MKLYYIAPEMEIVRFRLTKDILDSSSEKDIPINSVDPIDDDDDGNDIWEL